MDNHDQTEEMEGIAIIGMAGRFPKAKNVKEFWENLKNGRECISFFKENELELTPSKGIDGEVPFVAAKGILDDVDMFDARFWGYTPKEASLIDPQQRFFLECSWEAMEDAAYDMDRYDGAVGVFGGCYIDTYLLANLCSDPEFLANFVESIQVGSLQTELGNDKDYIATRTAFKMNLRGPAVNVQTACSTSMVAISMACQSLLNYQCDMALAGGATITLPQKKGYFYTEGGMLSKDGHCKAFDAQAAGTVFSNAAAVILLKRESEAIADGDNIYAVIKSTAMNNDGGDKMSFTAPSVQGQAEVIAMAHSLADIDARTIGYIEAHGTATPLGDPIEVAGLTQAFRETTKDNQFCALGSVKTNIGHLDVASGVTGVIKTALSLKNKVIVPSLNYKTPNPEIRFEETPFFVNADLKDWAEEKWPRRAGISAFGVGGTNAHVLLQEAKQQKTPEQTSGYKLVVLSARSKTTLQTYANDMATYVLESEERLDDIAYTSQIGRKVFEHRACFVADSNKTMAEQIQAFRPLGMGYCHSNEHAKKVVFMFPGQGSQYPGMAEALYQNNSVFRHHFDQCAEILRNLNGIDLCSAVFKDCDAEKLKQTTIAQPAIFSIEYALAQVWLSWGLQPSALIGHSVGEYCAATIAGVFQLADALKIVARRGEFMQEMPHGSMLSVRTSEEQLNSFELQGVDIAAVNAPELCVISGTDQNIKQAEEKLTQEGIPCSTLHTSHAFHSQMMEPALLPTEEELKRVSLSSQVIPIMSTVKGRWLSDEEAVSVDYWKQNLRDTVRFAKGIQELVAEGFSLFLEAGPGQTLKNLSAQCAERGSLNCIASMPLAQSDEPEEKALYSALGRLWSAGAKLDWNRINEAPLSRVSMPTYPFEKKRFWVNAVDSAETSSSSSQGSNLPSAKEGSATNPQGAKQIEGLIKQQINIMNQQVKILNHRLSKDQNKS